MSMIKMTILTKPKRDKDGKLIYVTEQSHKDSVNVNNIIKKYARTGVIEHIKYVEPTFTDTTGADFKTSMDKITKINQKFEEIPANIRKRFDNDPSKLMAFYADPANKEEARKMGFTRSDWAAEPTPEPTPEPPKPAA